VSPVVLSSARWWRASYIAGCSVGHLFRGGSRVPNSALLTNAFISPLRCALSAARQDANVS
jgi:hypothetical protein